MAKLDRYDLIDHFINSSGYDIALMTTFNFEIPFFERAIVNRLYAGNVKKIALFVDANELEKSVQVVDACYLGRRYSVNPVRITGAFHPKVVLLLGKKKAKLIVGSSNIKTTGYMLNNEVFNYFEYSGANPENINLVNTAIDFFVELSSMSHNLDNDLIEEVMRLPYYSHRVETKSDTFLIHNLKTSIITQLSNIVKDNIETIDVAVPYFDTSIKVIEELNKLYPRAQIKVYLQNGTTTFPKKHLNTKLCSINGFNRFKDEDKDSKSNFYHGKVFLFKSKKSSYIMYGSANCTQAALIKIHSKGGNVECNIIEIGERGEYDYFFNNIVVKKDDAVEVSKSIFASNHPKACTFEYGDAGERLLIRLRMNAKCEPIIKFGDISLNYSVDGHEIIVEIPNEIREIIPEIFELKVLFDNGEETVRCWANNREALYSNRLKSAAGESLIGFEVDPDDNIDKYNRDRTNLLNAMLATLPEVEEYKKMLAQLNRDKTNPDDKEEPEGYGKDYVVNIDVIESYTIKYRQINQVKSIQNLFLRGAHLPNKRLIYIPTIDGRDEEKPEYKTMAMGLDETKPDEPVHRGSRTSAQRFARFVKNRIRGLFVDGYVKAVNVQDYYGVVRVILDIFERYMDTDVFDADYILETRTRLYVNLLSKEISDEECEIKERILFDCCELIMDTYYWSLQDRIDIRDSYDELVREILLALKKDYPIRNDYMDIFKECCKERNHKLTDEEFKYLFIYVEERFGYKEKPLLIEYIKGIYKEAEIEFNEKSIIINARDNELKKHFIPNMAVLGEIAKYNRHHNAVNRIVINVIYDGDIINRLSRVEHIISLTNHSRKTNMYYNDGAKSQGKSEFINI